MNNIKEAVAVARIDEYSRMAVMLRSGRRLIFVEVPENVFRAAGLHEFDYAHVKIGTERVEILIGMDWGVTYL